MFEKFQRPAFAAAAADAQKDVEENKEVHVQAQSGSVRIVDSQEENNLSRALSQRHIQMIALAGAIVRLFLTHHVISTYQSRALGFS